MTDLLLVGSARDALSKIQAVVQQAEPTWRVSQCPVVDTAIAQLEQRPTSLVVAGFGAGEAEYSSFFTRVMAVAPGAIRIALYGGDLLPAKITFAHQTLATRKDLSYLLPVLRVSAGVAARASEHVELQKIVAHLHDVPSPPALYFDIREQMESEAGTTRAMAEVAARDPALVAQIMKTANSGFFALPRTVGDLSEAIGLIGMEAILGLVLAAHLFAGLPPPGLRLEVLWQHVIQVSKLAVDIARIEGGDRRVTGLVSVAGLLHDIGLMILLENEAARYQPMWHEAGGDESILAEMERETFGVSHGELGAIILMLWGLPDEVVDAVGNSHVMTDISTGPALKLSLASKAVIAAEWLLDGRANKRFEDLPGALHDTCEANFDLWMASYGQIGPGHAFG